jgi:phosphoserine phosphatase
MLPCILNGKEKEHSFIQEQEEKGVLDYISADYLRAELLLGLDESKMKYFADFLDCFFHIISLY